MSDEALHFIKKYSDLIESGEIAGFFSSVEEEIGPSIILDELIKLFKEAGVDSAAEKYLSPGAQLLRKVRYQGATFITMDYEEMESVDIAWYRAREGSHGKIQGLDADLCDAGSSEQENFDRSFWFFKTDDGYYLSGIPGTALKLDKPL